MPDTSILKLQLEEESREFVTVNTHMGLYRYNCLPFGITSATAIFQKMMDTILQGLNHIQCYVDDILVTGADDDEHFHNLEEVLVQLRSHGIWMKSSKCRFLNQACASHRPASAWFLKIEPVRIVCMHACVSAPEAINN